MMTIAPDEFWIADISFTNASGSKKQPVLMLWLDGSDLVVAAVATAGPQPPTDVALTDWKTPGLLRTSTVRLSRLDCFEQTLLIRRIGTDFNIGRCPSETGLGKLRSAAILTDAPA